MKNFFKKIGVRIFIPIFAVSVFAAVLGYVIIDSIIFLSIISFVIVIFSFVLAFVIHTNLESPLKKILNQLSIIREGNFARFDLQSTVEMNRLVEHINQMAERIAEREQDFLQQLEYMRSVLNTQNSLIMIVEGDVIIEANDAFLDFFHQYHYDDEFQQYHKKIRNVFLPKNPKNYITSGDEHSDWIEVVLKAPPASYKAALMREDSELVFSLDASTVKYGDRKRVIVVFTDITQLEKHREILEEKVREEVRKNQEKDIFISEQARISSMSQFLISLSHHWRQPLNNLAVVTETLKMKAEEEKLSQEEVSKIVNKVQKQIQRMAETMNLFRELNENKKEVTSFPLEPLLLHVLEINNGLGNRIKFSIERTGLFREQVSIFSDKQRVKEMFFYLVQNSIDAWEERLIENREMHIVLSSPEEKLMLTIEDNAGGVRDDLLPSIFNPYFTTKGLANRPGLGLFLLHKTVEEILKGSVSAENGKQGLIIKIVFPQSNE